MPLRLSRVFGSIVLTLTLLSVLPARAADTKAPDYVSVVLRAQVNRPADVAWKRISGFCDIAAWLKETCTLRSGSGDVGTVRIIRDVVVEVMVAKTAYSYTYWQSDGNMASASYHGTVAIEPDGRGKSTIIYTLMYNQAALPSDDARAAELTTLKTRFQGALDAMKAAAEAQP
jgi:Polyketide cyclase / dehydrase and lipid transport